MPAKKKQASLGKTKNTTTYKGGGEYYKTGGSKIKMYKKGGSVSGTPKSLPGGCGGMRKN